MCTRYISPEEAEIERFWHIGRHDPRRWIRDLLPRAAGPFIRRAHGADTYELMVGQWALIPDWESQAKLRYATFNARSEELAVKRSYKTPWARGQRCIIPADSFDEPCWETGRNIWWRFHRADGAPWGLAGLWNTWTDKTTGEVVESYTMLTINADAHPIMSRMHKPDPKLPPDRQDKRSVISIELSDVDQWLLNAEATALVRLPAVELLNAAPLT